MDPQDMPQRGLIDRQDAPTSHSRDAAMRLVSQGQILLLKNQLEKGLEYFDRAIECDPINEKIFYNQALSLFEWGSCEGQEKILLLASKKLKVATDLQKDFPEAFQAWGSVLLALGLKFEEHHYFQNALEKLQKALSLITDLARYGDLFELYCDLGSVWTHLAEHSQEPVDLEKALYFFEKAKEASKTELPAQFWEDFGSVYLKKSTYNGGFFFLTKAMDCFQRSLSIDSKQGSCWILLGQSFARLYEHTHERDHLNQAETSFAAALELDPQDELLYVDWIELLLFSLNNDFEKKRLESCLKKCQALLHLNPSHSVGKALQAAALALLGEETENPKLISDALNTLDDLSETEGQELPSIFAHALALKSAYYYFEDLDYLYQTIEKLQEGLSLDSSLQRHWHEMGRTYTLLGDLQSDAEEMALAVRFFEKALKLHTTPAYQLEYAVCLFKLGEMIGSEEHLTAALHLFEAVLEQHSALMDMHPEWLYAYGSTLDTLGDFSDEEEPYVKAIDVLTHLLLTHPHFHPAHHRLALTYSHLGDFAEDPSYFSKAISHYRICLKQDEENDAVLVDWALTLINLSPYAHSVYEKEQLYKDAEHKLLLAANLGNVQTYYYLSGLYSLMHQPEKAMFFLKKSSEHDVLPSLEDILEDEWLDNLRMTRDFQKFLLRLDP